MPLFLLTFRHGLVSSSSWPHSVSMATEGREMSNDGRFAEAHVANDHHTVVAGGVAAAQVSVHFLEEPLPPTEQPIR